MYFSLSTVLILNPWVWENLCPLPIKFSIQSIKSFLYMKFWSGNLEFRFNMWIDFFIENYFEIIFNQLYIDFFKVFGDIIVKDFISVKEIGILDCVFYWYALFKLSVLKTLEMFTFIVKFVCFITYITIVFFLFGQEHLK